VANKGRHTLALYAALRGGSTTEADRAAVELAKGYARRLDADGEVKCDHCDQFTAVEEAALSEIGPKYLAALTALGLTLAGRAARGGATSGKPGGSKIDELKQRRRERGAG
jgi:hypothetical protein